jgi:hypothetical protein
MSLIDLIRINFFGFFHKIGFFPLFVLPVFLVTCSNLAREYSNDVIGRGDFHYDLNSEDGRNYLGYELDEISGLTWLDNGVIGCIQDEDGKFVVYDFGENKIKQRIKFSKSGDYEGTEVVDKSAFVIRSDGKIFSFQLSGSPETEVIENALGSKNDVEGLGYYPESNSLIIACKGKGEFDDNGAKVRAFYLFDVETKKLSDDPFFEIDGNDIENFLEDLEQDPGKIKFKPSAIAFHPIEKRFYILSSPGSLLVILSKKSEIETVIHLDGGQFKQPEGICFSPEGNMYISSEGQGFSGYILRFNYQNSSKIHSDE